jgi:hypothetical protein
MVRNLRKDKRKSQAVINHIDDNSLKCMLEDCNNTLSYYDGPGSRVLCREHQLECVEYGGMGKPERPHTFYRNWQCDNCGYDPREDELRFGHVEDEYDKIRAMRGVMHGDHIHLKSKGGTDTKDNISTLCVLCHMAKTYTQKDYLGKKQDNMVV